MTIGVFDSGIGGMSVARAIELALPEHKVIFRDDKQHLPYGSKTVEEIRGYVTPIIQEMSSPCDVIVIACNTVSTNLIAELRSSVDVPLVAVEPMVKSAVALSQTKVIAVCATPRTLASARYGELKARYAHGVKVIEPDCSDWTTLIENNQMDRNRIKQEVDSIINAGADVIVLGCTHYHWIERDIKREANGKAQILQPETAVVEELKRVLERLA